MHGALLDGSGSSDPDADTLTYTWTGRFGTVTGATPVVTLPLGASSVTLIVDDGFPGGTATDTVIINAKDTTAPVVSSSVGLPMLSPPNHDLVNVELGATAMDNCTAKPTIVMRGVLSTEADVGQDADRNFSPDAANIGLGTLRLRSERPGDGNGRVYLNVVKATDAAGNVGISCSTVVVPLNRSSAGVAAVNAMASAAQAFCIAHAGSPPPGYFAVGTSPTIGSKQ